MSLTIQQIIVDAKRLSGRLKERDTATDRLLTQTHAISKKIDAMKQVIVNLAKCVKKYRLVGHKEDLSISQPRATNNNGNFPLAYAHFVVYAPARQIYWWEYVLLQVLHLEDKSRYFLVLSQTKLTT